MATLTPPPPPSLPPSPPPPIDPIPTRAFALDPGELGEGLRAARLARNWSIREAAQASGTGKRFVLEAENGKSTLRLDKLRALLDALGLAAFAGGAG